MVTRNDRRAVATRMRTTRRLTIRHGTPQPAEPPPDDVKTERQVQPAPADAQPNRRWRLAAWTLAVALLGVLAAAGLLARQSYDQNQLDTYRQQALAAARQATVDFVSISAASIDRDLQRIADHATGQFKDEFTQDLPQVRSAVVDNKVDSHGTVLRAAVVSSSRTSAVVLVAVDATVKNASAPDGRLSHYRIRVSLSFQAGRWLVSKLDFVG
jgi:Mce-associated membrane protein